jgi:uncharacterized protein
MAESAGPRSLSGAGPADALFAPSAPRVPQGHLFETAFGSHFLVANGSRVYRIGEGPLAFLIRAMEAGEPAAVDRFLAASGLAAPPYVDDIPPVSVPARAFSLAVAQKCNLGCTYCYAQQGSFGGPPRAMPLEVALASVERLFRDVPPGERVSLAFLGGEPLTNRPVLRAATEHASRLAEQRGVAVSFSVTTNGTLLTAADGDFFEAHGFAVTISLDGLGDTHDRLRPYKNGQGSFDRIVTNASPLLGSQRRMQVSARVTVTPRNLGLRQALDGLLGLGFHSVGFSPMLSSPSGCDELDASGLAVMLREMISCGEEFERHVLAGRRYPFLNAVNALREIHKGTHRPYPCGAGGGYFGVSADGDLFACHRFVGDPAGAMGNLGRGVDPERQRQWLADRHVHRQEPCRSCWARYLCGGGCHHEVMRRGRPACDYIRGWLHYCLQAYVHLRERRPDYFGALSG